MYVRHLSHTLDPHSCDNPPQKQQNPFFIIKMQKERSPRMIRLANGICAGLLGCLHPGTNKFNHKINLNRI